LDTSEEGEMNRSQDGPLREWAPNYKVGADGKVEGAVAGEPNNWGRWGATDQKGTANLCTEDRVLAASRLIRRGRRFSLGIPIGGFPTPTGRPEPLHFFTSAASDAVLGDSQFADGQSDVFGGSNAPQFHVSDDHVVLALQYTTQLDGFGFGIDNSLFNGYWAGLVTARSGARRLGMQNRAEGYVGRGVLVDVARHLGVERLDDEFRIDTPLLEATLQSQGVTVGQGDILLVRTGYLGWYINASPTERPAHQVNGPGLSATTIPWLAEHGVSLVAIDYLSIEVVSAVEPGQRPIEFHIRSLHDLGLGVGETFDLDELADDCAQDHVYEFFFVASPLPIQGGCGSPLNPIAIK
jgi:kynurenine formamidase